MDQLNFILDPETMEQISILEENSVPPTQQQNEGLLKVSLISDAPTLGQADTWLSQGSLTVLPSDEKPTGAGGKKGNNSKSPKKYKWEMDPENPELTAIQRKSIIKSKKCRLQRQKVADAMKAKDDTISELRTQVEVLEYRIAQLELKFSQITTINVIKLV